jgi:hypothetical protein
MNTKLQTADFCVAHKFTKGQAINFEVLMLVQAGMGAKAAMRQVCGMVTDTLPADTTDEALLQAVKDLFFEACTDEQIALMLA